MSRALLIVGCLLCLSLPATAVAGPGALDGTDPVATEPTTLTNETTPMLGVSPPAAQGHDDTEFDPGVAFSVDRDGLQSAFDRHRLTVSIENASTEAERRLAVSDALDVLRDRLTTVRERERSAVRAYAAGTIDAAMFRQRMGEVHAAAGALASTVESIQSLVRSVDGISEATFDRANTLSQAASALTGPVRERLAAGIRSREGSDRVYAAVTDDGAVLATVEADGDGPTYVREGVRLDNRDTDQTTTFASASEFYDFMAERYPDATSGPQSLSIEFPGSIHRFDVQYGEGSLTAFVDGSARGVFRDVHRIGVDDVTVTGTANATADGLSLRVNRTFATGPVEVTVTGDDGAPVDADVSIANRSVGATGVDGALWTVAPDGEYRVTATRGDDSVSITVG